MLPNEPKKEEEEAGKAGEGLKKKSFDSGSQRKLFDI